jgi:hypothetical protein
VGLSLRYVVDVVVVFIVSIKIGGQGRLIAKLDVVRLDIDKLLHRVLAHAVAQLGVDKSVRREIALGRRARRDHAEDLLGQLPKDTALRCERTVCRSNRNAWPTALGLLPDPSC